MYSAKTTPGRRQRVRCLSLCQRTYYRSNLVLLQLFHVTKLTIIFFHLCRVYIFVSIIFYYSLQCRYFQPANVDVATRVFHYFLALRMINPASVHDIIIFYLRNICAITKTQFTIQNALLRNNQTARGHVEKIFSLSYRRPLIYYIMIAGHVVIDKSPIFRPVTFLVAFGVVSVAQWAHSTGKVPSNNVRLRPPRTVKCC